ncbi:MAG TPA: DUF3048 domain-containing protein [Candidatus Limnocylindrales bacterium]|nr:DUF3048 domain-containing protein [Candidatus Limnocylindrales bacterium]
MNRVAVLALGVLAVLGGLGFGLVLGGVAGPAAGQPGGSGLVAGGGSGVPSLGPAPTGSPEPGSPAPSASVAPSSPPGSWPSPPPSLVPAPLTGRPVTPAAAARHPIAVMIDDHSAARPQSGFNAASVVWHAPAEGGIPRYMLVFQEAVPDDVGPVRSARSYYISWASELRALYVHAGGSPQAMATLRAKGNGQLVYNADEFRWGGSFRRVSSRFAPHNLYTTGAQLRSLAAATGAQDRPIEWPWTFRPDAPIGKRPVGGRVQVSYLANTIRYDYHRLSNTYRRAVTNEKAQVDGATKKRVAPKNVVVMLVRFGPLNDGTTKRRLEAQLIGSGPAWISSNGVTVKGTWRKRSETGATRFYDAAGKPIALTVGQTFIQVMPYGSTMTFTPGRVAPPDPFPVGPDPR